MAPTAFDEIALIGEQRFSENLTAPFTARLQAKVRRRRAARAGVAAFATVAAMGVVAAGAAQLSTTQQPAVPPANPGELYDQGAAASDNSTHLVADCTPDLTLDSVPREHIPEVTAPAAVTFTSGAACALRSQDAAPSMDARLYATLNSDTLDEPQVMLSLAITNFVEDRALVYDPASVRITMTAPETTPRIDAFTGYPNGSYYSLSGIEPVDWGYTALSVAHALPFDAQSGRAMLNTSTVTARIAAGSTETLTASLGMMPDPSLPEGYPHYVLKGYPEVAFDWRTLISEHLDELRFTVQLDVVDPSDTANRTTLVVRDPALSVTNE